MSFEVRLPVVPLAPRRLLTVALKSRPLRYLGGVLAVAACYYGTAKLGQTLRYTASVSAIWPPAGFGMAVLYLWGLRWWPGVFLAESVINAELLSGHHGLPLGSLMGQQAGNMAEIVFGAWLLRRLIGPRAGLDRIEQVVGMVFAIVVATGISAMVGTLSIWAGGVIHASETLAFWRTWWLGDASGGLVVLPLLLVWAPDPVAAFRRLRSWEGGLMIAAVTVLGTIAVSTNEPVTYMIFPALIWAAFRFGPPGATLAIVVAAGVAIAVTANQVGPFSNQPIDHRALSTQVFIAFVALTTLLLSAIVSERERSAAELADAKRREGERALEERHRIARDLHDSVSQALFSTALHTRTAQKAMHESGVTESEPLARDLSAIGDLTRNAQAEMRELIFELRRDALDDGLVSALSRYASKLNDQGGLVVRVDGPSPRLALSPGAEAQLFSIGREALTNVVKHAQADSAWVRVEGRPQTVLVEIRDDGRGFDPGAAHPGHLGLESMRSRAGEIGGVLTIESSPDEGTVVRVEAPTGRFGRVNGG
ncbi:MAG: MASE1 domain-containing protein [Thermoleophilaceae bacterium]